MLAVMRLCTSFPIDLRRAVRSRAARRLVYLLALLLIAMNAATAAMPLAASTEAGAPHGHGTLHAQCAGHAVVGSATKHAGHCACCDGACACLLIFDAPVLATAVPVIAPSTRIFSAPAPRAYAAIEARRLRPPIA
jgi:hypothetical protein